MNTLELLYNKALMKDVAQKDEHIKKGKVWFNSFNTNVLIASWLCIKVKSRELKICRLSTVPTRVLTRTLQRSYFPKTSLVDKSLFLALPQEVFIFFGEGSQMHILVGVVIHNVLRIVLNCFAVSEKTRPHRRPTRMENLSLRHISADWMKKYSKMQSSYWSISFKQGVVSKVGGTEAGTFPK